MNIYRPSTPILSLLLIALTWHAAAQPPPPTVTGEPWQRHTIDNTVEGADGSRPYDFNGDGLMDFVTPFEEGAEIRLYRHPGEAMRESWPYVSVGKVASPEDAFCVDLDGDGSVDVVSSTEGQDRSIYVHWGPTNPEEYMQADNWVTEALPATKGKRQWMFAVPIDIDGKNGIDIFAGSKNEEAMMGWFKSPMNPRRLEDWTWHPVRQAAWTMSLHVMDMDDDNDWDIVYSERRGQLRGMWWLRHPGPNNLHQTWKATRMSGHQHEVMFMNPRPFDPLLPQAFVAATSGGPMLLTEKAPDTQQRVLEEMWNTRQIAMPENTGTGKAAALGDINGDGALDLVVTCERAEGKHGVFWMSQIADNAWSAQAISGLEGTKFDLVILIDLDGDGDLDVATCEEGENLGIIWYENPYGPPSLPLTPEPDPAADAPVEVEAENEVIEGEKERKPNKSFIRRLFRNE